MSESIDLQPIKQQLSQANRILVMFGQHATVDHVASATALFLSFQEQGKDVTIASPAEMRAEFSRLVGLDEVSNSISNRDLVISFDNYEFSSIERVSHNDGNNNRFELIIQPKAGKKAPDPKQISFGHRGADADIIFMVGVNRLEDLGDLYENERSLFSKVSIVSFNRRQDPNYASTSLTDQKASSLAEMVTDFLEKVGMVAKNDIASNLLAGIDFATNRFQNPMISPSAFSVAGKLLENGAKRQPPRLNNSNQGGFMPFVPPSANNKPEPQPRSKNQGKPSNPTTNPPQDWLKPKIYKGGTKV